MLLLLEPSPLEMLVLHWAVLPRSLHMSSHGSLHACLPAWAGASWGWTCKLLKA